MIAAMNDGMTLADIVTAATAVAALALSLISLWWQWSKEKLLRQSALSVEAEEIDDSTWRLWIRANGQDRSHGLMAVLSVPPHAGLLPEHDHSGGLALSSKISLPLHYSSPDGPATGVCVLRVSPQAVSCEARIELRSPRSSLIRRAILISPTSRASPATTALKM